MKITNVGKIIEIKDGIAVANGLSAVGYNEYVVVKTTSGKEVKGLAWNLEADQVGIVLLGDANLVHAGDTVSASLTEPSVTVSNEILGRVIDALGNPIDGAGDIKHKAAETVSLFKIAPGVIDRKDVTRPVQTGIKSIDALTPIGRGQRQLIIGDRQTGKTAITIDTIINQAQSSLEQGLPQIKCIYVAIGQKVSKVARIVEKLKQSGAFAYTTVVLAGAAESAAMQYLAAYTGTAIGEYFATKGEDALVIYDDLTKHAWAYREISLLLRRPPGREAYPGDIFYLHSSLLERSVQFSDALGAGSLTALPIVETQAGDVSAYIPTNIISITDGQIYLEADLFNAGIRPAINVGLSVSRVGGSAQIKPMKQVAGQLRLDLAQYRSLAAFAQFGSDLDAGTRQMLDRGARVSEILKQPEFSPVSVSIQIILIYAGTKGYLDKMDLEDIKDWETLITSRLQNNYRELLKTIATCKQLDEKIEKEMITVIEESLKKFIVAS